MSGTIGPQVGVPERRFQVLGSLVLIDSAVVTKILKSAVAAGASDVHFKAGEPVLLRIRGDLQPINIPKLMPEDTKRVFESLRPASAADVDADQMQELDFAHSVSGLGRFRVNAFRQRGSIALVVRIVPLDAPKLKDLNLPDQLPALANERRGLVLVTGTTGSGKSTTLAAMIDHINHTKRAHVITIEDPIEFFFRNKRSSIVQREIGIDTASFSNALRAALRQDPDILMIGEMRDTETIEIALKAAETGHLVLSTTHTTDATKTVQRILSVFPPGDQAMMRVRLSECLRGVVSQRLLPRADGVGLIPAVEVMVATRVIQESIRDPERTFQIQDYIQKGKHYGMQTFDQALLGLVNAGHITWEVALSAASSPGDLDLQRRMGVGEEDEMTIEEHQSYAGGDEDKDLRVAIPVDPPPSASADPNAVDPPSPESPATD
jgi:twitching motility protein PilT